ncbi:MAG: GxxExxY protein [Bacteroidetes bacterium]|nr:GxxExxY protein [Bacteroidota bacterium]
MRMTKDYIDELTYRIIGCAIEVHRQLGPGLIESVYEKCFERELEIRSINFKTQLWTPVHYKGVELETELKADVLIEDLILVELKAIEGILPVHHSQVITYMKLMQKPKGILINFNCTNIFKEGQKTFVNDLYKNLPRK